MIYLGGVPEHFNLPFTSLVGRSAVPFAWGDYAGGTGALAQALEAGTLQAATLLTEGFAAWRARRPAGQPGSLRLLGLFVASPLRWGVHTGGQATLAGVDDLQGRQFAISRQGSGSQLMAYVLAEAQGWPATTMHFVEVGNLAGAVQALNGGEADGFLWERFMTAPLVAAGTLRRLGEVPTPWPAFVLATTEAAYAAHGPALEALLLQVRMHAQALAADTAALAATVATTYGLAPADAAAWAAAITWAAPTATLADAEAACAHAEATLRRTGGL